MKRPAPLAALLPALLITACGGGGGSAGGVAKADYLKRAEAICAKANADEQALKRPTSLADLSPYVSSVVALADTATHALSALETPKADRSALESKVLTRLQSQLSQGHVYAEKVAAAQRANNQAALAQLLGNPPTGSKADLTWMKHYGFVECVKAADTSG